MRTSSPAAAPLAIDADRARRGGADGLRAAGARLASRPTRARQRIEAYARELSRRRAREARLGQAKKDERRRRCDAARARCWASSRDDGARPGASAPRRSAARPGVHRLRQGRGDPSATRWTRTSPARRSAWSARTPTRAIFDAMTRAVRSSRRRRCADGSPGPLGGARTRSSRPRAREPRARRPPAGHRDAHAALGAARPARDARDAWAWLRTTGTPCRRACRPRTSAACSSCRRPAPSATRRTRAGRRLHAGPRGEDRRRSARARSHARGDPPLRRQALGPGAERAEILFEAVAAAGGACSARHHLRLLLVLPRGAAG